MNNRIQVEETYITVIWPTYTLPAPAETEPKTEPKPRPDAAALPRRRRTTKQAEIKPIILKAMETCAPAGVDGIAKAAGLDSKQVNPRMSGLLESGKVCLTGRKVPGDSGALQREWDLVRRA